MSKNLLYFTALFTLLVMLAPGCDSLIYDDEESFTEPVAYLQVTRAQGAGESINEDATDYEDRVHDLAMLAFDSSTGEKVGEYYGEGIAADQTGFTFTVKLTPGTRDLYFVANVKDSHTDLKAITAKGAMDTFMAGLSALAPALYQGATETVGFPMSRVYPTQTINGGGTLFNPLPFKPNGNEDAVKLIRVVAKLEVRIAGSDLGVESISYRNANRKFSLKDPADVETPDRTYYEDAAGTLLKNIGTTYAADGTTPLYTTYLYYMPESIISAATWQENPDGSAMENKPVNYFTIKTLSGETYDVPIITHEMGGNRDITNGTYLAKAKGQEAGYTPNYSIDRNRDYVFSISNLQTIEINYVIDPWNRVTKSLFMGYGYNVEVDEEGNVSVMNTVEACPPYEVKLVVDGGATFRDEPHNEKIFDDHRPGISLGSYPLVNIPPSGDYLHVEFNGERVYTFRK